VETFTREGADSLRDAVTILYRRSRDPRKSPPQMTGLAMLAAGLDREAGRIEEEIRVAAR
jgi:hypothetical protein